ncbi:MAG: DNA polymerase III subunit beta [Bacillota bacterium]
MKLLVAQPRLSEALQAASYFTPPRTLSNAPAPAVLRGEEGTIWIYTQDFGQWFECNIPGEVIEPGEVRVPLKILVEVVKKLPTGAVMLSLNDGNGNMLISTGNSNYAVVTLAGAEVETDLEEKSYPPEETVTIPGKSFGTIVASTAFAASSDLTRDIMTGVNMRFEENFVSMAAVDGVRLAYNRIQVAQSARSEVSAVVPAALLGDVARICQDKETVEVQFYRKAVCFKSGNYTVFSRTLEGKFPAYKEIINIEGGTSVIVGKNDFCDALERVSLFSRDTDKAVVLDLEPAKVVISSMSADVGSGREEVPARVEGERFRVSFNARYLLEGMKPFSAEDVLLQLTGPVSKACVRAWESTDWVDYRYILMPLKME